MRKLYAVLAITLMFATVSVAQAQEPQSQGQGQGRGGRGGGRNMMAALLNGITLTADQQAKVDSITKKYADARQAMMADESMDRDARRAKGRELMTKQQDEIKAVLTDEQKVVFDKNAAEMRERMQGGGRPPRRG